MVETGLAVIPQAGAKQPAIVYLGVQDIEGSGKAKFRVGGWAYEDLSLYLRARQLLLSL